MAPKKKVKSRPVTIDEALKLAALTEVRVAPDRGLAVFLKSTVRREEKTRATHIGAVAPRPLSSRGEHRASIFTRCAMHAKAVYSLLIATVLIGKDGTVLWSESVGPDGARQPAELLEKTKSLV